MFQPEVKLEFVRRYCSPAEGWDVFVDIDASEEGRTGGPRINEESKQAQQKMLTSGLHTRKALTQLGVQVGGNRKKWLEKRAFPCVEGDRDIIAFHKDKRLCLIAEVEGASSGQPEQKIYKAIGQLVMAASNKKTNNWEQKLVLVIHGQSIAKHLQRASALRKLGISAVVMDQNRDADCWLFREEIPSKLSSND